MAQNLLFPYIRVLCQCHWDVLRMLTDRGTEYCGREDRPLYQLFLGLNDIEHTRIRAKHPQTNGICKRFHQTSCLNEFHKGTFRKKIYHTLDMLQGDLDTWMEYYNPARTHQGKRCQGQTPMQTFLDGRQLVVGKRLEPMATPPRMGLPPSSSEAAVTATDSAA